MSETAVGVTPSAPRYSTAFHSVAATRSAGPSRVTSLPRESVTVISSLVVRGPSVAASSVVPQPARSTAAMDRPMILRISLLA